MIRTLCLIGGFASLLFTLVACQQAPEPELAVTPASPSPSTAVLPSPTVEGQLIYDMDGTAFPEGVTALKLPGSEITALDYSSAFLAVASDQGLYLYPRHAWQPAHLFTFLHVPIELAWSPDEKHLAVGLAGGDVSILDLESGGITTYDLADKIIVDLEWSPDSSRLIVGSLLPRDLDSAGFPEVLTLSESGLAQAFESKPNTYFPELSWSPDGRMVAAGCFCAQAVVWDAISGLAMLTLEAGGNEFNNHWVEDVAWSPAGDLIAYGQEGYRALFIFDGATGERLLSLDEFPAGPFHLAWSADGHWLFSLHYDDTVRVWDTTSWQQLESLELGQRVWAMALAPDGTELAVGTVNGSLILWDVSDLAR